MPTITGRSDCGKASTPSHYGELWLEVSLTDTTTGRKRVQRVDQFDEFAGQGRRSRVTYRFLERFVFPEIAALVNRFVVVDHVVVLDTGWILCTRNAPSRADLFSSVGATTHGSVSIYTVTVTTIPGESTVRISSTSATRLNSFRYTSRWRDRRHSVSLPCHDTVDMSMRTWNDRLFLDAMPGRTKPGRSQGDFAQWEREMKEHAIGTVVCLAPDEQIAAESPEYAEWLDRHEGSHNAASVALAAPSAAPDVQIIRLPIDDFSIPVTFQVPVFWKRANEVAATIGAGERVFIHCGAGFGRTGMFAVAVLVKLGYSYDEALAEIRSVGSFPETQEQREFVRNGDESDDEKR
jgi:hypothetical protein